MIRRQLLGFVLAAGFLLGVQNGNIALWWDGNETPTVFPYKAAFLPPEDRRKLEEGIRIDDEAQLRQLLEDYLS